MTTTSAPARLGYLFQCPSCGGCNTFAAVPSVAEGLLQGVQRHRARGLQRRVCSAGYGVFQNGSCTQCASLDDEPSVSSCQACTGPEVDDCLWATCSLGYGSFAAGSCSALECTTTSPLPAEQGYNVTEISLFGPTFNVSATACPALLDRTVALVCTRTASTGRAAASSASRGSMRARGVVLASSAHPARPTWTWTRPRSAASATPARYAGCGETECTNVRRGKSTATRAPRLPRRAFPVSPGKQAAGSTSAAAFSVLPGERTTTRPASRRVQTALPANTPRRIDIMHELLEPRTV